MLVQTFLGAMRSWAGWISAPKWCQSSLCLFTSKLWLTRLEATVEMLFHKTEQSFMLRLFLQTFREGKRENEI